MQKLSLIGQFESSPPMAELVSLSPPKQKPYAD